MTRAWCCYLTLNLRKPQSRRLFLWNFSALIAFPSPHAFLISPWKLQRKGEKEVGIDASFRLIRVMIRRGISEIKTNLNAELGFRGEWSGRRASRSVTLCMKLQLKKEVVSLNHDATIPGLSAVFLYTSVWRNVCKEAQLCVCMCGDERKGHASQPVMPTHSHIRHVFNHSHHLRRGYFSHSFTILAGRN